MVLQLSGNTRPMAKRSIGHKDGCVLILDSVNFSLAKLNLGLEGSPHASVLPCSRAKWERGFQGRLRTHPTTEIVGIINSYEKSGANQTYRGSPSKPKGIKHLLTEQGKDKSEQRAEELIGRRVDVTLIIIKQR